MKSSAFQVCFYLIVLSFFFPLTSHAQLEKPDPIPSDIPEAHRFLLVRQFIALNNQRDRLERQLTHHNAKCNYVSASNHSLVKDCKNNMNKLINEIEAYNTKLKGFRMAINYAVPDSKYHNGNPVHIGAAGVVQGEVLVKQSDGSWKQIQSGTAINSYDCIRTGLNSKVQFLLHDDTVFTIGPDSEMVLDEFVYDPYTDVYKMTAKIVKGVCRFVTGKVARRKPSSLKVGTPNGGGGIRGSDLMVTHEPFIGISTFYIHDGKFEFTPKATGKKRYFSAGHIVTIGKTGIVEVLPLFRQKWRWVLQKLELPGSVK